MRKKIFVVLLGILVCACTFSGCNFSFFSNQKTLTTYTSPIEIQQNATVDQIYDACVEAMVTIFVVNNSTGEEVSFGSGVAVASGGYIATNYHVIQTAIDSPSYSLNVYHNKSLTSHTAKILWHHANFDSAIIKCSCGDLPYLQMQDRVVYPTNSLGIEQVVALGTPIDFSLQNTITVGYVSSKVGRVSYSDGIVYEQLIQHTAPINHGNSGGALLDMQGKLIGLNTLGNDDANSLFFAVPIYPIMTVIDRVVNADKNGTVFKTPVIGFSAVDKYQAAYSNTIFEDDGLLVTKIAIGGGSAGKLLVDDIVKGIKVGQTNYTVNTRNDMLNALIKANSGDTVQVTYVRGIVQYNVVITLG